MFVYKIKKFNLVISGCISAYLKNLIKKKKTMNQKASITTWKQSHVKGFIPKCIPSCMQFLSKIYLSNTVLKCYCTKWMRMFMCVIMI